MSFASLVKNDLQNPRVLRGSQTQGRIKPVEQKITANRYTPSLGKGSEYAVKYRDQAEEEERQYQTSRLGRASALGTGRESAMSSITSGNDLFKPEELTSMGTVANINDLEREELTQVYHNYNFDACEPPSEHLEHIHCEREQILNLINYNQVCIIKGPTGCGKSTQIPQFILDFHASSKAHCNIVVSQPRRIAAMSLAKRVCEERHWELGTLVGYQVGLDKKANDDTRLLYCTTGVLLEKLIARKELNEFTHILLDEVHERDEDMDFAMLITKRFLRTNSPNVKVILMSATMDVTRFAKYFEVDLIRERQMAPFYEIEKPDNDFHVYVNYIDDFKSIFPSQDIPAFEYHNPGIPDEFYDVVLALMVAFNNIDDTDYANKISTDKRGAVLVFLPGLLQIETLYDKLSKKNNDPGGKFRFWLCPLHSSITKDEQEKVRLLAPNGQRKIILSTNIAESSLTIPDVKYVIDFCLTKHLVADPITGFSSLQLAWASHTNCIQRQGRVGRVQDGRVYRMVTKEFYDLQMRKESVPEMQRCPLDIIVLKCKRLMENECPIKLISCALDPPDLDNYQKTIQKLKEVGALLTTCNGKLDDDDGDLTVMGKVMAALPVDIRVTKLILLGHVFDVLEEAIIIGSCMTVRNIFSDIFQDRINPYNNKLLWADESESDSIASMNAYKIWRNLTGIGKFDRDQAVSSESSWARRFMLQIKHLKEVAKLEEDITRRLKHFNIQFTHTGLWDQEEKPLIIKLVLAGAFYPHYYYRRAESNETANFEASKTLAGFDPNNHVLFRNMPLPAHLYFDVVKERLSQMGVSNDVVLHHTGADSRKLYVEFKASNRGTERVIAHRSFHASVPGDIAMPVYRAIKMRQQNVPIKIKLLKRNPRMTDEELSGMSYEQGLSSLPRVDNTKKPIIPMDKVNIEILVTHVENAGEFYGSLFPESRENFLIVEDILRTKSDLVQVHRLQEDRIYAAPYLDLGVTEYYRAKVINYTKDQSLVEVFYIDFGNTAKLRFVDLMEMGDEEKDEILQNIPPIAIKCVLAEVKPSIWLGTQWCEKANNFVKSSLLGITVFCKVYSFVGGVANVHVLKRDLESSSDSLNNELLKRTWAEKKPESYFSWRNHIKRVDLVNKQYVFSQNQGLDDDGASSFAKLTSKSEAPVAWTTGNIVELKGPHSPLEMKLGSMVFCSLSKDVKVEASSVNSVLLDSEPEDPHLRLLVAGSVSQSTDNKTLFLNDTTVLPNMNGLAALLCLIFTPYAELRTDKNFSRYTGALCGLGATKYGRSLFPENDLEITFDSEITKKDLLLVNKLRYWINSRYHTDHESTTSDQDILRMQKQIRNCTHELLKVQRNSVKVSYNSKNFRWGLIPEDKLCSPWQSEEDFNATFIYKLHYGIELNEKNAIGEINALQDKIRVLTSTITRNVAENPYCPLCDTHFDFVHLLKIHMQSMRHKLLLDWLDNQALRCGIATSCAVEDEDVDDEV